MASKEPGTGTVDDEGGKASTTTPLERGSLPDEQNGTGNMEGRAPVSASCNGQAQHARQSTKQACTSAGRKGQCHPRADEGKEAKHPATSWRGGERQNVLTNRAQHKENWPKMTKCEDKQSQHNENWRRNGNPQGTTPPPAPSTAGAHLPVGSPKPDTEDAQRKKRHEGQQKGGTTR